MHASAAKTSITNASSDAALANYLPLQPAASRGGWLWAIGTTLFVGLAYYVAARFGLAFVLQPEAVAVFWPASGLACGAMLILGRRGMLPVAVGIFLATVTANLTSHREPTLAILFGCCNAGEALIFAWLVRNQPWSRSALPFASLGAALWFFLAAGFAAGSMAMLATAALQGLGASAAPVLSIWWVWLASDTVGIVMFAPFLMTLDSTWRQRLPEFEAAEGSLLLVALVAVTALTFFATPDAGPLHMLLPSLGLFPLLLWSAARCRPVFPAAGIAITAIMIVWAMAQGLGQFGGPGLALRDRVLAAQVTLFATAFCGLVLVSTFNQRRGVEEALRANEERFQKLATAAPGLIYSFRADNAGLYSFPFTSNVIQDLLGFSPSDVREDASKAFLQIAPEDVGRVTEEIEVSRRNFTRFHSEFRYLHPVRGEIWLEANSNPVREPDGSTIWHGFLQDVTPRKRAEARAGWLTGETYHRNNNLLTVVQGVAVQTARDDKPGQFVETFCKRIDGLAASHDLLVDKGLAGVTLAELAHSQLSHFAGLIGSRIRIDGPVLKLKPEAAQTIGMVLHELATNANKYGALSGNEGMVDIAWSVGPTFRMRWSEAGGPPPEWPARQGFGHRVLSEMAPYELGAQVQLTYATQGLVWHLEAPLNRIRMPLAGHSGRAADAL